VFPMGSFYLPSEPPISVPTLATCWVLLRLRVGFVDRWVIIQSSCCFPTIKMHLMPHETLGYVRIACYINDYFIP
jgi:hypothetical protein